jgi:NAD(P)-dependent dehydrogenase (short-subunit alcohol dehydrogenase family)
MYRPLKDMRILLTGASSGIGWHLALELTRCGGPLSWRPRAAANALIGVGAEQRVTSSATQAAPGNSWPVTSPNLEPYVEQLVDHCFA